MTNTAFNLPELQTPIKAWYQEQPEAARITLRVKSAGSDLSDPLHCAVAPAAAPDARWRSGAHPGIEIEALEVEGIGDMDLRGTLGMDREVPVGFTAIRCETRVTVKDGGRPERAKRLLENAEKYASC